MDINKEYFQTKEELYRRMEALTRDMAAETDDVYAVLSNVSAMMMLLMPDVSWSGFYLMKKGKLVLGPFQGKPAVAEIAVGKGVCGTAAETREVQIVADVHTCANHIACDASTASEIVVPIEREGVLYGVIDIDSRKKARFDEEDGKGLQTMAAILAETLGLKLGARS